MPTRRPPSYAAPAVEGALSILESLGSLPRMGVSELAKTLGLSRGSVYRLLVTLVRRGYVEKDASDRYRLTYRLFAVGSGAAERLGLREVAQPVMERLGAQTRETLNLGVLDDFRTVSVHLVESEHPLRIHMRIGGVPAHATSTGKILLAWLPPEELERRLVGRLLTKLTGRTIRSRSGLSAELARVRRQGYAIDDEECSLGLRCVGAPVRDRRGAVVAALSLVAPCHRLPPEGLPAAITLVCGAAAEISLRLGYTASAATGAGKEGAGAAADPLRSGRQARGRPRGPASRSAAPGGRRATRQKEVAG